MIKIIKYIRKYYIYIVLSLLSCIGVSITTVMLTDLLKLMVDGSRNAIFLRLVLILLVGICSNYLAVYLNGLIGSGLIKDLRMDCIRSLLNASPDFINNYNMGDIMERVLQDVNGLADFIKEYSKDCIYVPVMIIVYSVYLIKVNAVLALCCLSVLIILVPLNIKYMKPVKMLQFQYSKKLGETNNNIWEAFNGAATIKAYNLQTRIMNKYYELMHGLLELSNSTDIRQYRLEPVTKAIQELPVSIALVFGGIFVLNGKITVGDLIAYISILRSLVSPLSRCYQLVVRSQTAVVSITRVFEVIDIPKERNSTYIEVEDEDTAVEFENVTFNYGKGEEDVLKDISFKIKKGSRIAFVGKSGSGKSTILKIIATFFEPYNGTVKLYGSDYKKLSPDFIRSKIAYVSQEVLLFPVSVEENIRIGNIAATKEQIESAIYASGCEGFKDVMLTENGTNLSGGQRQRLAIARALVKDADIYLFDEPTSALDVQMQDLICETIAELPKDKTVITVAHNLGTVEEYDHIYTVEGGRICRN